MRRLMDPPRFTVVLRGIKAMRQNKDVDLPVYEFPLQR